jgi:hypothetical protein
MPREKVLEVMGPADSSEVTGEIEVLDFKTIEWLPPYTGIESKTIVYRVKLRNGVVFSHHHFNENPARPARAAVKSVGTSGGHFKVISKNEGATKNEISILSIVPETAQPNVPTKFVIRVAYSLKDHNEALVLLMFNTKGPRSFTSKDLNVVYAGSGVAEYTVTINPKRWPSGEPFAASAFMFTENKPIASGTKEIALVKGR